MTNQRVERWVRAYSNVSEKVVWEELVPCDIPDSKIRSLLRIADDDPMYDSVPLTFDQACTLSGTDADGKTDAGISFFLEAEECAE